MGTVVLVWLGLAVVVGLALGAGLRRAGVAADDPATEETTRRDREAPPEPRPSPESPAA